MTKIVLALSLAFATLATVPASAGQYCQEDPRPAPQPGGPVQALQVLIPKTKPSAGGFSPYRGLSESTEPDPSAGSGTALDAISSIIDVDRRSCVVGNVCARERRRDGRAAVQAARRRCRHPSRANMRSPCRSMICLAFEIAKAIASSLL